MRNKLLAGVVVTVLSFGCGGGANATGGGGGTATGGGSGGGGGTMTGGGAAMGGGTMTGGGTGGGGGNSLPTLDGGEDCATATLLTPGMWSSTTDGLKSSFLFNPTGACWGQDPAGDGAPDSVFKIHLTNGQRMKATVTGADWDAVINLVASPAECGSTTDAGVLEGLTCLTGSDIGVAMDGESVAYTNSTGAAQDVLLLVDGYHDVDYGAFEVDLAVDTPAAGDSCVGATALTVGQMLQSQSLASFTNDYPSISPVCAFPTTGPDRVYTVDVAAQSRVVIQAQATGTGDFGLSAVDAPVAACISPPWCIAAVGGAGAGALESLEVDNPSMATRTIFVIISEPAAPASGETFTLSVSGASLPPALPGDTCATAVAIDAGTLATETTAGFYGDYVVPNTAQGCNGFTSVGPDRVYAIDVAPGQTLSATVTPAPSIDGGNNPDPALFLLGAPAACQSVIAACLAGSDVGLDGDPETAVYTNDGGTPVNVLILVDSYYTDPIASYTLQTTLTP